MSPMRSAVRALALVALAATIGCGERSREMTIVIVSLDTTRPDHLSAYGYDKNTSPGLKLLAEQGTLFTNARTTSPWTLPAHVSLFTGMTPREHDVVVDFQTIPEEHATMGQIFKEAEYHTYGLFTAPYVHARFGFDRGFDIYENMCEERMLFDVPMEQWADQMGAREVQSHREVTSARVAQAATSALLSSRRPRRLMFLHLFDPHYDFLAPKRYVREFTDPLYSGTITGDNPTGRPDVFDGMPAEDLAHLKGLYDAEIRWTDDNLMSVANALRKRNDGNTLLIVVADHGEEFFEHGRFGHRANLKDPALRVPMIVWGPGLIPAGQVIDDEVSITDVLPTALDYAGLEGDSEMSGRSLRTLIESNGADSEPVPVHSSLSFFPADAPGYYVQHDSMVLDGMKVIRQVKRKWLQADQANLTGDIIPDSETIEIFDLGDDPMETRNIAGIEDRRSDVEFLLERLNLELTRQGGLQGQESDFDLGIVLEQLGYLDTQTETGSSAVPAKNEDDG